MNKKAIIQFLNNRKELAKDQRHFVFTGSEIHFIQDYLNRYKFKINFHFTITSTTNDNIIKLMDCIYTHMVIFNSISTKTDSELYIIKYY